MAVVVVVTFFLLVVEVEFFSSFRWPTIETKQRFSLPFSLCVFPAI